MPDTPRKKHEAFGLRLRIAVHRLYRRAAEFAELLDRRDAVKPGAFYFHLAGDKKPRDAKLIRDYEMLLRVPRGWIEVGDNETVEELAAALDALLERDLSNPVLTKLAMSEAVNHATQQTEAYSGKVLEIRHIPILSHEDISVLVAGEKVIGELLAHTMPIPLDEALGPRAFVFVVPMSDASMTSSIHPSFPPRAKVVIDPDQKVAPGEYGLFRLRAAAPWVLRRYKGAGVLGEDVKFSLEALNPSFEAIRIGNGSFWRYGGRAVSVTHTL